VGAPTDIAGLQVWLDGSDPSNGAVPANGATMATWVDKSGNARSAVPVDSLYEAVYTGAGTVGGIKATLGAMYFKNTPYKIPYTSFGPDAYTIFSVFRAERGLTTAGISMTPVVSNSSCFVLTGTADYQLYFGMYQDKFATAVGASGAWYGLAASAPSTTVRGQWVLATMQYNATTKTTTSFLNGIAMTSKGPDAAAQNGGAAWTDLYIGRNNSAGADYRLQGHVGEILIYNSVLSSTDRLRVETYLSVKYGLGVDARGLSAPTIFAMPTSFTYSTTTGDVHWTSATMTITATGGSTTAVPIAVFYAASAGLTSVSGMVSCGTGTLVSNSASVSVAIAPGRWYVYIRVTSPYGVLGPLLGAATTVTASAPLRVRYIRLSNVTTTDSLWCGKVGLYASSADAAADAGSATTNAVYAARATATMTVNTASSIVGTASGICGATSWAYQATTNYFKLQVPTLATNQSSFVTIDLGSAYAVDELSGMFLRLAICGGNVPYSRLRCQLSADGLTYYERQMSWTTSDTTYSAKTAQWYTVPSGAQMQMIPTSFALTKRTTGTPRDLSVDANRTGVTRGLRKWDAISISSQDFSSNYVATEEWWYLFNGVRGSGTFATTGSAEQNTLGYALKVGGGLVYSHNVYSLNCTSLYMVTSWETGTYSHVWAVSASNDQVNWTEMATGAFTDTTKMTRWTANAGDGGILFQGAAGGTLNMFYKLSWTNTQYYVYWKVGIKTAGTPFNGTSCNCGVVYEIEWG
jgi:hypothetical protein